jgi:hypothetical protein
MNQIKVLISLVTNDNDFQLEQAASAKAASAESGATVEIIYAANDAVAQDAANSRLYPGTFPPSRRDLGRACGHRDGASRAGRSFGWHRMGHRQF